jgi:hypothetical protein
MSQDYFSADYSISIVEVKAENKEQVEAILQEFTDKIAEVMKDKVQWDEANWDIQKNIWLGKEGWTTE